MSQARLSRNRKQQLGQFLTPPPIASAIVERLQVTPEMYILEPSLGEGAFIFALLDALGNRLSTQGLAQWANANLYGCEIDDRMLKRFAELWKMRGLDNFPKTFVQGDFFRWLPPNCNSNVVLRRSDYFKEPLEFFDLIVGNPPFGGSFDLKIQDPLDAIYGTRNGLKIKKETYSFFLLKCLDLLKPGGQLCFICSDTLLTIATMRGLRHYLQENCEIKIESLPGEFEETAQSMILIKLTKRGQKSSHVWVFDNRIHMDTIASTPNLSWRINGEYARYFSGRTLGDYFVASSGMTIGNNELFLRKIINGSITEPYEFFYAEESITLAREIERARLGKLSVSKQKAICEQERCGETRRVIRRKVRKVPLCLSMPHEDYKFYNKATSTIIYSQSQWAIFWKDDGEYVYTFKKSGKWYLHGVGGKKYFGREGITWSLIAPRMYTRWLPPGYILDSGAPCAFPRPRIPHDELFFVMGWTLTDLCNNILKNVINHTRNIQSKDFERLPYPVWVSPEDKDKAIEAVKGLIHDGRAGQAFSPTHPKIQRLDQLYAYTTGIHTSESSPWPPTGTTQMALPFPSSKNREERTGKFH